MIGIDPHKGSHTAVAIDEKEATLSQLKVRATRHQVDELVKWAAGFDSRTWAVESAGGLGYLLSQQLLSVGEDVLDVPATLSARVRVLASGKSGKNDPNDAFSVAVAALRSPGVARVRRADHAGVLRLLAKYHRDLGSARTRCACRLHALLAGLVPGGVPAKLYVPRARKLLEGISITDQVQAARKDLAAEHLAELSRLDGQLEASKERIGVAVAASGTSLLELFGVGPVVACILIGYSGDIKRFVGRDAYANYNGTAPVDVCSGGRVTRRLSRRGNRQLNHALHIAAVTQVSHASSKGHAYFERKIAEGKTKKEALRSLKRHISDTVYSHLLADATR
jgi:transposase